MKERASSQAFRESRVTKAYTGCQEAILAVTLTSTGLGP